MNDFFVIISQTQNFWYVSGFQILLSIEEEP